MKYSYFLCLFMILMVIVPVSAEPVINPVVQSEPFLCRFFLTKWLCELGGNGGIGPQGIRGINGTGGDINYYNFSGSNLTTISNITNFFNYTSIFSEMNQTANMTAGPEGPQGPQGIPGLDNMTAGPQGPPGADGGGIDTTQFLFINGTRLMTGNLQMDTNRITGLGEPIADTDAATQGYVLDAISGSSNYNVSYDDLIRDDYVYTDNTSYWQGTNYNETYDAYVASTVSVVVNNTVTLAAGESATVANIGDTTNVELDFGIPAGLAGDNGTPGTPGTNGTSATATANYTFTGSPGTNAIVTNVGTGTNALFDFTIPRGATGSTGSPGTPGTNGTNGNAATIGVNYTFTGAPGTSAIVSNVGSSSAASFDFTIPQGLMNQTPGQQGAPGTNGTAGSAATITVNNTVTLASGNQATVTNIGSTSAAAFDFGIPTGATGSPGTPGINGTDGTNGTNGNNGTAATITVNATFTGAAGSNADVANVGTTGAASLDFTIPQGLMNQTPGQQGDPGTPGTNGTAAMISINNTVTLSSGNSATVTNVGTSGAASLDFGIPQGTAGTPGVNGTTPVFGVDYFNGSAGAPGDAATINVNSTSTGAAGTQAEVTNVGNETNVELDFSIPRGSKGDTGAANMTAGPKGDKGDTGDIPDSTQFPFLNGTRTITGIWNMGGYNLSNLLDPVSAQDAATRNYVLGLGYITSTYNATYDSKPSSTYNSTYDAKPSSTFNSTYDAKTNYNASYWTGTNYNASYLTSTYNATYDAKTNYNASYWTGTNYNASYWTGSNYNATYDGQSNYNASYLTSTYNATYDAKPSSNYNATYDAKTNYNASYWTGTNYNSSYLTSTYNATYDAKNNYNASYVTTTNGTYVLTNNGSYVLTSNTSYFLTNGARALTGNMSAGSQYINNLISGTLGSDAVNKSYVDSASSNYNASYLTSTYNSTYDSKPSSTYNATYDAKTNYNSSYWTGTNFNASYWTGTNYNASYLTSTYNATYDAKNNYNASYLNKDGTVALTGNLNLGSKRITSLITGLTGDTAVNKSYVDAVNATGITDHGALTGLTDDDHGRYFDKDGSKALTGLFVTRSVNNSYIILTGGTARTAGGELFVGGIDATGIYAGGGGMNIVDADGTSVSAVWRVAGKTDTPFLNMLSHRIAGIAAPTTAGDALIYQAWAAWSPTLVWSSTTPAGLTTVARWTQTGKIVSYVFSTTTADSNARSLTTVTLPTAPSNVTANIACASIETSGAAGVTYTDPLAYIKADGADNKINFRASVAGTDAQRITYEISGSYEVA